MIIGGGRISFRKERGRSIISPTSSGVKIKVTRAEILEEMCRLDWIVRETLRAGGRLNDAEGTILMQKSLFGRTVFPVTDTNEDEEIKRWLNTPTLRVLIRSVPIDYATMEGILKKALQESFDSSYQNAKCRAIGKNEIMSKAMIELMEIPHGEWSKRWEILSKAQEACSDVERGGWRKYLEQETGQETDKLEE